MVLQCLAAIVAGHHAARQLGLSLLGDCHPLRPFRSGAGLLREATAEMKRPGRLCLPGPFFVDLEVQAGPNPAITAEIARQQGLGGQDATPQAGRVHQ